MSHDARIHVILVAPFIDITYVYRIVPLSFPTQSLKFVGLFSQYFLVSRSHLLFTQQYLPITLLKGCKLTYLKHVKSHIVRLLVFFLDHHKHSPIFMRVVGITLVLRIEIQFVWSPAPDNPVAINFHQSG